MRGVAYGLIFSILLWGAGCMAYKRAYVAIHDSIDEVLSEKVSTNSPAAGPDRR